MSDENKVTKYTVFESAMSEHGDMLSYSNYHQVIKFEDHERIVKELQDDLKHMTERFERNSIAAGSYSLEVAELKTQLREYAHEFETIQEVNARCADLTRQLEVAQNIITNTTMSPVDSNVYSHRYRQIESAISSIGGWANFKNWVDTEIEKISPAQDRGEDGT